MKYSLSIILAIAIMLQTFNSALVIMGYELNKEYITAKYCENKSKPKMNCHGKCHLGKELKAQEKKEQAPGSPAKEKQESVQYFLDKNTFSFTDFASTTPVSSFYQEAYLPEVCFPVFHPPA